MSAGVVADGAIFVSLAFMDGSWEIARIDNAGALPDVGDAGMPTFDAVTVPAACLPGASALGAGAASHTIQEIPLPSTESGPGQIALGSDGNLWFTEVQTSKLGRVTPTGCVTEFSLNYRAAEGLTAGSDGALWFTQPGERQIGRMTTSGVLQEFTLPAAAENPDQIVAGSDGNLWFTDPLAGAVGRMTIGGVGAEYPTPTQLSNPIGIAAGSDGFLWVVESGRNIISRVDPSNGVITELPVVNASLGPITTGPDGDIWFQQSQNGTAYFVQLKPDGTMTPFPLPAGVGATAIVSGPDGNLWFVDSPGNFIGQMRLDTHAVAQFPIPTDAADAYSLVVGPDGNLWFTEGSGNRIGQFRL